MLALAQFESLYTQLIQTTNNNPSQAQTRQVEPAQPQFKPLSVKTQWLADAFNQLPPTAEWCPHFSETTSEHHPLQAYFAALERDPPTKPIDKLALFAPDVLHAFFESQNVQPLHPSISVDCEVEQLVLEQDLRLSNVRSQQEVNLTAR